MTPEVTAPFTKCLPHTAILHTRCCTSKKSLTPNIYNLNYGKKQKQAATLAYRSSHKMASRRYTEGMRPERAPKQTLFSSVEYRRGEKEKHTAVEGRQSLRHTRPLEQDIRTGAHHRYLFGHHYGNNISRKKRKRIILPTVRRTGSLHHRGPQYVHLTVTKFKRIKEKWIWK